MTTTKEPNFPEAEAWAASMPDLRSGFSTSSVRKVAAPVIETASPDIEYNKFAMLDLSNM